MSTPAGKQATAVRDRWEMLYESARARPARERGPTVGPEEPGQCNVMMSRRMGCDGGGVVVWAQAAHPHARHRSIHRACCRCVSDR